ncbi:hypothetical protein PanWU01x14_317150 [Parasponia andersonii]|uniref:Uncharacterized protein n=1 Tax=Parasponia andersonii TaxID=3476 RepID=A0A2P5AMS1_PARAD|nr:hypothetical protein PanWU01x14_317150 [Parasponia andersonii]
MADYGGDSEIRVAVSSSSSSSIVDVLRDLNLSDGEKYETSSSALGADEEGKGDGIEDEVRTSDHNTDEVFMADSDNEFCTDDMANIVTLRTLNQNQRDFLIPVGM